MGPVARPQRLRGGESPLPAQRLLRGRSRPCRARSGLRPGRPHRAGGGLHDGPLRARPGGAPAEPGGGRRPRHDGRNRAQASRARPGRGPRKGHRQAYRRRRSPTRLERAVAPRADRRRRPLRGLRLARHPDGLDPRSPRAVLLAGLRLRHRAGSRGGHRIHDQEKAARARDCRSRQGGWRGRPSIARRRGEGDVVDVRLGQFPAAFAGRLHQMQQPRGEAGPPHQASNVGLAQRMRRSKSTIATPSGTVARMRWARWRVRSPSASGRSPGLARTASKCSRPRGTSARSA